MNIGFIVGTLEQHQMELSFDQTTGDLRILMDGAPVLEDSPRLARNPVKQYELYIGSGEKHKLALQLTYADGPGIQPVPRLGMTVTPVGEAGIVPQSLALNGAATVFNASAAARA